LSRTEVLEDREVSLTTYALGHCPREFDATAHADDIDVLGRTLEEEIAYVTAHYITLNAHIIGCCADEVENRMVEQRTQLCAVKMSHEC
jgi:hypothetical protein